MTDYEQQLNEAEEKIITQQKEIEQLKEENKLHKGISDSKSIIINQLEEEIRILKQYSEIARNDKHQRKIRLNKALEEIKQLKNK